MRQFLVVRRLLAFIDPMVLCSCFSMEVVPSAPTLLWHDCIAALLLPAQLRFCTQVACYKICNVRVNAPRQNGEAAQQPASLRNSSNTSKQGLLSPHVEEVTKSMDLEPNAHEKASCCRHMPVLHFFVLCVQIYCGLTLHMCHRSLLWRVHRQTHHILSGLHLSMGRITCSSEATWSQGAFETWLLLEYADRGALDKAVSAGRFRRKSDGTPELVWALRALCRRRHAIRNRESARIVCASAPCCLPHTQNTSYFADLPADRCMLRMSRLWLP